MAPEEKEPDRQLVIKGIFEDDVTIEVGAKAEMITEALLWLRID